MLVSRLDKTTVSVSILLVIPSSLPRAALWTSPQSLHRMSSLSGLISLRRLSRE